MSNRKYRQQGYQDGEREKSSRSSPPPERDGPRGRGLGRPTKTLFRCRDCGTAVSGGGVAGATVATGDVCGHCGAALHSCVNCRHFDPSVPFECRQSIQEAVRSKTGANDCELFEPKRVSEYESGRSDKPDDARSAFDDLFDF